MTKEAKTKKLLNHLLSGFSVSALTATQISGISGSCFHRRLTDLRTGKFNGVNYPIDYGYWVEHGGVRYKVYQMDLTKL